MTIISRSITVAVLLSLCGCGFRPSLLPWQGNANQEQSGSSQIPKEKVEYEREAHRPPLLELTDSNVRPLDQAAIERCKKLLTLAPVKDAPAHSSNYGDRKARDQWGRPISDQPQLIVVHETVIGLNQTVDLFQTPHPKDDQQASYHLLIDREGNRWRIVPDSKRAYGSGMSAFGDATQRTMPGSVGSINNIALHVSLVSPDDGRDDTDAHSGYTDSQYRNLAGQVLLWQAMYGIPMTRVTTHLAVDRSHSRYDPRSFRWYRFDRHYRDAANRCKLEEFDNAQAGL